MINETHDTYQYLRPKSDSFYKSDFIIPGKEPIDIFLELNHLNAINNSLLGIILDLNKDQISKGFCLVVVKSDITDFSKRDSLIVVPTIKEVRIIFRWREFKEI